MPKAVLTELGVSLDEVEKGQVCWGNDSQMLVCNWALVFHLKCGVLCQINCTHTGVLFVFRIFWTYGLTAVSHGHLS